MIIHLICFIFALELVKGAIINGKAYGLTFGKPNHLKKSGIDEFACEEYPTFDPLNIEKYKFVNRMDNTYYDAGYQVTKCNPYQGDTLCTRALPILCIKKEFMAFPNVVEQTNNPSFLRDWTGGHAATTVPIVGEDLRNYENMNKICQYHFGALWHAASFHEMYQFRFYAFGNVRTDTNYWIYINNQSANCWN